MHLSRKTKRALRLLRRGDELERGRSVCGEPWCLPLSPSPILPVFDSHALP